MADLVVLIRRSTQFSSILRDLDYGAGFVLIYGGAPLELAPILSSLNGAWKEFSFYLVVKHPEPSPTSQVHLHP